MATIRLSNAGGNWVTGATWDGGVAPGAGDDVVADVNSGNLVISSTVACHSFDGSAWAHQLSVSGTRTWTVGGGATLTTAAVFRLGPNVTFGALSSLTLTFDNRSGGITFQCNPTTWGLNSGFSTVNLGTTQTTAALITVDTTSDIRTLTSVNIVRGGLTVNSGVTMSFSGAASVNFTATAATTITYTGATISMSGSWNKTGSGALTMTGNGSSLFKVGNGFSHTSGATTTYPGEVRLDGTGQRTLNCTVNVAFTTLTLKGTNNGDSVNIVTAVTTISTLNCQGGAQNKRLVVCSISLGTAAALTVTTNGTQQYVDFRDITINTATLSGTSVGDAGGNSGITFTGAVTRYWVGADGDLLSMSSSWATTSGGAGGASTPLPQDSIVFDANSFPVNGRTAWLDAAVCVGQINTSATTKTHTLALYASPVDTFFNTQYASTFSANTTISGASSDMRFLAENNSASYSITWNGCTIVSGTELIFFGRGTVNTIWTFADDLYAPDSVLSLSSALTTGIKIAFNGNIDVLKFVQPGGTIAVMKFAAGKQLRLWSTANETIVDMSVAFSTVDGQGCDIIVMQSSANTRDIKLAASTWTSGFGQLILDGASSGGYNFTGASPHMASIGYNGGAATVAHTINATVTQTWTLTSSAFLRGSAGQRVKIKPAVSVGLTIANSTVTMLGDYIDFDVSSGAIAGTGATPHSAGTHSIKTGLFSLSGWNIAGVDVSGTSAIDERKSPAMIVGSGVRTKYGVVLVNESALSIHGSAVRTVFGTESHWLGGPYITAAGVRTVLGNAALTEAETINSTGVRTVLAAAGLSPVLSISASGVRDTFGSMSFSEGLVIAAAGTLVTVYGVSWFVLNGSISADGFVTPVVHGEALIDLSGFRIDSSAIPVIERDYTIAYHATLVSPAMRTATLVSSGKLHAIEGED